MELRDLVREARSLPPGTLSRSSVAFLLEEGRLRLEDTGILKLGGSTRVAQAEATTEAELMTSELARRRGYAVEPRSRKGGATVTIGRDETNDVAIDLSSVSHRHATIERLERGRWAITDGRSRNGTFVDGTRLRPGDTILLRPGQVVRFGPEVKLTFLDGAMLEHMLRQLDPVLAKVAPDDGTDAPTALPDYLLEESKALAAGGTPQPSASSVARARAEKTEPLSVSCQPFPPIGLLEGIPVTVGRVAGNDLILPHPQVSRKHARFERRGNAVTVIDLKSANGTFVGGQRVDRTALSPGARVSIGPYDVLLVPVAAPPPGRAEGPESPTHVIQP